MCPPLGIPLEERLDDGCHDRYPHHSPVVGRLREEFRRMDRGWSPPDDGVQGATSGWNTMVSRAGDSDGALQMKPVTSV
jgi:hypothetical protein